MVQTECRKLAFCRGAAHSRCRITKFGCKGTNNFRKSLQYRKKVVPLHPHFGKTEAFDDVNRLVIRSKRRPKDVYANNI